MAAYWSTLAYQSLFVPTHFFGRQEDTRAFDCGYCAEFVAPCRALTEGADKGLRFHGLPEAVKATNRAHFRCKNL